MNDLNRWENKFELCYYSELFLKKLDKINNKLPFKDQIDLKEIKKAIYYAKKYHANQKRDSGEPYYTHPIKVASMVADYNCTNNILVTAILHDILEDTECTKEMIECIFSKIIANQIEDLSRKKIDCKISSKEMIESLWTQKKQDLLLIKCFDRIHNLQTIQAKSSQKLKKTMLETLEIFIAVSAYLEIRDIEEKFIEFYAKINNTLPVIQEFYHRSLGMDPQLHFPVFQNDLNQMKTLN